MDPKLIEVKISKASLFLTPEEYTRALRRGKAVKRRRAFLKRQEKCSTGTKREYMEHT